MARPTDFTPPWKLWCYAQALKGILYCSNVTIPSANLLGKTVLITGANSGIGREAALLLASWGANLILACRPNPPSHEPHPEAVVEECRAAAKAAGHGDTSVEYWEFEASSLASVEALGARFIRTGRPLDIFLSNVGMGQLAQGPKLTLTDDGFELLTQVNFFSHALLTLLLLPAIAKAPAPRIVYTVSGVHYIAPFNYDVPRSRAYASNKLYLLTWLNELQVRMARHPEYRHIVAHGVHPGFVDSGIFQKLDKQAKIDLVGRTLGTLKGYLAINSQQGSLSLVNAATGAEFGLKAADNGDGLRGGAMYFNRIWPEESLPQVRSRGCRKIVWDHVSSELKLQERPSLEKSVKAFAS